MERLLLESKILENLPDDVRGNLHYENHAIANRIAGIINGFVPLEVASDVLNISPEELDKQVQLLHKKIKSRMSTKEFERYFPPD